MKVDSRTTNFLFRAEAFWNGFGFFATYDHANLMRDAVSAYMRTNAMELKSLVEFENNLEEAIAFVRLMQEGKGTSLEKKIGEEIDRLNLRHHALAFKFIDLESAGLLTLLENSREMPKRETVRVLHQILALQEMCFRMDEALNEGVNQFSEENELEKVKRILHKEFDINHIDQLVEVAKSEPLSEVEFNSAKRNALAQVEGEPAPAYHRLFDIIFQTVRMEKEKLGME